MMKRVVLSFAGAFMSFVAFAQLTPLDQAKKDISDGRLTSAVSALQAQVQQNPSSAEANYWLGQAYLAQRIENPAAIDKARSHYQNALNATSQNPLIVVGNGHVEMLDGKETEARTHFNAAIEQTASRKNKRYGDPEILKAFIRAVSDGTAKMGDIDLAIAKSKNLEELEAMDAETYVNVGKIHLKRGGEYGGPAKRAFDDALAKNGDYAEAYYRIGKIFESQRNIQEYLGYYIRATQADSKFLPAYLSLYDYYKNRDVNEAKKYMTGYLENADKNLENDYWAADFEFRSGNYQQSLERGKQIEASLNGEKFPKVYKLYAYNYDRLGDSLQALQNMEKYMAEEHPERISADDYSMMATVYLKVPEYMERADAMTEKAVEMDTVLDNKLDYMKNIADVYASRENFGGQYKWLEKSMLIREDTTARNFYFITDAAHKAGNYEAADKWASRYIASYPDQVQGYFLRTRSAIAADPDTSMGSALPAVDQYITFLKTDSATNKNRIISQIGYKIYYYLVKANDFQNALKSSNEILAMDPENEYAQMTKAEAERLLRIAGTRQEGSNSRPK